MPVARQVRQRTPNPFNAGAIPAGHANCDTCRACQLDSCSYSMNARILLDSLFEGGFLVEAYTDINFKTKKQLKDALAAG